MSVNRTIGHLDIDTGVSPHFKGKPIIVGSDPKEGKGRGVVSTDNYVARKFGCFRYQLINRTSKPLSEKVESQGNQVHQ